MVGPQAFLVAVNVTHPEIRDVGMQGATERHVQHLHAATHEERGEIPVRQAAVILLVAIIAAISLTMRKRSRTKYQSPSAQIEVRKADRLRVVKMPSSEEGK